MRVLLSVIALTIAPPVLAQDDALSCLQKARLIEAKGKATKPLLKSYQERDYESVITNALLNARTTVANNSEFGIAIDSARVLAELRSRNHDPYQSIFIDSGPPKNDPIGQALYGISVEVGANYWTSDVVKTVLPFLECSTMLFLAKEPRRTDYIAFGLSTLIAARKADAALTLMRNPKHSPTDRPGDYFVVFVKRFIGVSDYRQALQWMESVERAHTISPSVKRHWVEVLDAAISRNSKIPPDEKRELLGKLKRQEEKSTTPVKR